MLAQKSVQLSLAIIPVNTTHENNNLVAFGLKLARISNLQLLSVSLKFSYNLKKMRETDLKRL